MTLQVFVQPRQIKKDKVRTVYDATVNVNEATNEWTFTFYGNGFLYNMIRIIVGTVLEIADGRREVKEMKEILGAKDRNAAGLTIGAHGLRLEKVHY